MPLSSFSSSLKELHRPVDKLVLEDFQEKLVVQFLNDLEATLVVSFPQEPATVDWLRSIAFSVTLPTQEPPLMGRCQTQLRNPPEARGAQGH